MSQKAVNFQPGHARGVDGRQRVSMGRKRKTETPPAVTVTPEDAAGKRRQVYLDDDLYRKGGMIAAALGVTLPDWVNNKLRPIIEAELPGILEAMIGPENKKQV